MINGIKKRKARDEPSQALPRQLPQRGSQAVKSIAKVLGTISKCPGVQEAPSQREFLPVKKGF